MQRRLQFLGYDILDDSGVFCASTKTAVSRFQADRGLVVDGVCGEDTWGSLVEAEHRLGDRLLYYRLPMMRGDDVHDLQKQLSSLGFDPGWIDGIFGRSTQEAVQQFQRNADEPDDGVAGVMTLQALKRVLRQSASQRTVTEVREIERLHKQPSHVKGLQIVIAHQGDLPVIAQGISKRLRRLGADVLTLGTPNISHHANVANNWSGNVYLGVSLTSTNFGISYFATSGFESIGGKTLSHQCASALNMFMPYLLPVTGQRLQILRETRMPAVWCRLGPGATVVSLAHQISQSLSDAIVNWCLHPID